ncbi:unnamed protein product [Sphenostylis stenocarpa]|uniref:Uncharacterized protein n=1 Tax=Sphenostylis stenocarpa TaxID=92480 RepID=A0AA86VVY2_9FABA|nr:unnamed protein product [Sphenostylis stenocarpa]
MLVDSELLVVDVVESPEDKNKGDNKTIDNERENVANGVGHAYRASSMTKGPIALLVRDVVGRTDFSLPNPRFHNYSCPDYGPTQPIVSGEGDRSTNRRAKRAEIMEWLAFAFAFAFEFAFADFVGETMTHSVVTIEVVKKS